MRKRVLVKIRRHAKAQGTGTGTQETSVQITKRLGFFKCYE